MTGSARGGPALGEFLTALHDRLRPLSREDLVVVLGKHAERLPARERQAFLDIFRDPTLAPPDPRKSVGVELEARIKSFAARVAAAGGHLSGVEVDLSDAAATRAATLALLAAEGAVDLFVHSPAFVALGPVVQLPFEDWRRSFTTNLDSALVITQAPGRPVALGDGLEPTQVVAIRIGPLGPRACGRLVRRWAPGCGGDDEARVVRAARCRDRPAGRVAGRSGAVGLAWAVHRREDPNEAVLGL